MINNLILVDQHKVIKLTKTAQKVQMYMGFILSQCIITIVLNTCTEMSVPGENIPLKYEAIFETPS